MERVDGTVVRWTAKEAVIRFDWPHRAAWELELSIRATRGPDQLAGATAKAGAGAAARAVPVTVVQDQGGGGGGC